MDGAQLSTFPHHSWLAYDFEAPANAATCCWNLNGNAHALHMVFSGEHRVRWISRGHETDYTVRAGSFHYLPADGESHTIVAYPACPIRSFTVFVPPKHLTQLAAADHMEARVEFHRLLLHDDPVLQACMTRLAVRTSADDPDEESKKEDAARRLVLRLIQGSGGGTPDWYQDESAFAHRTLHHLVSYVDAHLRIAPSLSDMALLVGLSPSHFARKFRTSTGLSLHRFINRRRVLKSLDLLKNSSESLTGIALELGFSSQSHFTRLFSELTCMTPARYRKQFKRTVGCREQPAPMASRR